MKPCAVGLCTALALAGPSAAFLIPSTIKDWHPDGKSSLAGTTSQLVLLDLDCPDCPFAGPSEDDLVWVQGIENSLLLNFSVAESHNVELNGVSIFPPNFDAVPQPIPVSQVRAGIPLTNQPLRISAYALEIDPSVTSSNGDELIPMTLQLSALEAHRIGVPALSVKLIKASGGELFIMPITVAAPIKLSGDDAECRSWSDPCKWRAMISDRMRSGLSKINGGCSNKSHPDRQRPHHGHHGVMRHHRNGPLRLFLEAIGHILVPVLVGMSIGAFTYALGWMIGSAIALICITIRHRRANAYAAVPSDDEERGAKEELHTDAPPIYMEKEVVVNEGIEDRQL